MAQSGSQAVPLPALGADLKATSVSGLSSGAFMASQFQIAHSSIVIGAGIVAGGPYGCAESAYPDARRDGRRSRRPVQGDERLHAGRLRCSGVPERRAARARVASSGGRDRIDPIDGLARARVYLFSGTKDHMVVPSIVAAAGELYAELGVPDAK